MGKNSKAALDEQTPLLANSAIAPTADPDVAPAIIDDDDSFIHNDLSSNIDSDDDDDTSPEDKPLPKFQILLLCFARLVEPIAFFSIFPFVNQMVQRNGNLPEEDVGFYSGLIESLFSLTQMMVMLFWGRVADRIGRKPVLVSSLYGVAITVALFGFATTIWQMILFRCLSGIFAGSIVTVRAMVSELSTPKTQARAFSFHAFAGNLGIFLGPLIGGALADPVHQYPRFFSNSSFCRNYPYALPTLCTGAIGFIAAMTSALFVNETKQSSPATPTTNGHPTPDSHDQSNPKEPTTTLETLRYPGVLQILYLYALVMILPYAYTAIAPLFWFTSIPKGGFSFTPSQISLLLGLTGFAQAIWLLLIFPPLHDRFGTVGVSKICAVAYPFFFALGPSLNALLRQSIRHNNNNNNTTLTTTITNNKSRPHHPPTDSGTPYLILFYILTPSLLTLFSGVSMLFTTLQLAINDVSPSPSTLGTLNALSLVLLSALRSFSPWLFTALFALGARTQFLAGYAVWVLLMLMAVVMAVSVWRVMPGVYRGIEERRMRSGVAGRYAGAGKQNVTKKKKKVLNGGVGGATDGGGGGGGGGGGTKKKKANQVRTSLRRGRSEHV